MAQSTPDPEEHSGFTGYTDPEDQVDYLHNGDAYVEKRLLDPEPAPAQPLPPTTAKPAPAKSAPAKPAAPKLRARVREFEISRFAKNETKPSRFGADRVQVKVFFKKESPLEFNTPLTQDKEKLRIEQTVSGFRLNGELTDGNDKTSGVFWLTELKTGEAIEISYRAYKARLTMRRDGSQTLGPGLERQLKAYCDNNVKVVNHCTNSFGWVNSWSVIRGPSFYLIDIVRTVAAPEDPYTPPMFSFKGASKRTSRRIGGPSGVVEGVEVPAQSLTPDTVSDVRMWGNSESGGRRGFQLNLEDKTAKEKHEIYLDVEADEADEKEQLRPEEKPVVFGNEPSESEPVQSTPPPLPQPDPLPTPEPAPTKEPEPSSEPAPAPPAPAPAPEPPLPAPPTSAPQPEPRTEAFLVTDMSQPRPAKMVRDLNQNRSIPGVQRLIAKYQRSSDTTAFFRYANPFRPMFKAIAQAYDVSPAFGYLTYIEDSYTKNGRYTSVIGDGGLAVGPFQIHPDASREVGLPLAHRPYFAPAACGAARYLGAFLKRFNGDHTVAVLAYNQGGGTAGKLVERYRRMAGQYNYTYREMQRLGGVNSRQQTYVNKFLAIYFIGSNMRLYGFDPRIPQGRTEYPRNGSVFPPGGISEPTCRAAVQSLNARL